jgi:predicted MPP superfamily phosphohydrolase
MGISRRGVLRTLVASGVGIGTGAIAYGVAYERHRVLCVTLDLKVTGLPAELEGIRIGLITDIHHSETVPADDVSRAVSLLVEARPDMVVLGGDYVTFGDRITSRLSPSCCRRWPARPGLVCRPRQPRRRP